MNDMQHYSNLLLQYATEAGMKILAAIALWILGRWLIRVADKLLRGVLKRFWATPSRTIRPTTTAASISNRCRPFPMCWPTPRR